MVNCTSEKGLNVNHKEKIANFPGDNVSRENGLHN